MPVVFRLLDIICRGQSFTMLRSCDRHREARFDRDAHPMDNGAIAESHPVLELPCGLPLLFLPF
jgi:hypothetical protein